MEYKFVTLILTAMNMTNSLNAQQPDISKVKTFEHQLDDVMELTDTTALKIKLVEVEDTYRRDPSEINKTRLGIIYHETALNLSFLARTEFKGYAKKSYDVLSGLFDSPNTTRELLPFIAAYRASALSLVGAETKQLKLLGQAFVLFDEAVKNYAGVSYLPEFLRGSVAENLPWFFIAKRRVARNDFQSIIDKYEQNAEYANRKIMSFTYWARAKQRQGARYRKQSLAYLDKAITLDPGYQAGRQKAEDLKKKMMK